MVMILIKQGNFRLLNWNLYYDSSIITFIAILIHIASLNHLGITTIIIINVAVIIVQRLSTFSFYCLNYVNFLIEFVIILNFIHDLHLQADYAYQLKVYTKLTFFKQLIISF